MCFEYTVFSLINGHSKRRTPLISGQCFFHRPFSVQSLIKNFLKSGHSISGPSNQRTIFFSPISGQLKKMRSGRKKLGKLNSFSNIYFKHLTTLKYKSLKTAFIFFFRLSQFSNKGIITFAFLVDICSCKIKLK